jgi:hypothetical protein
MRASPALVKIGFDRNTDVSWRLRLQTHNQLGAWGMTRRISALAALVACVGVCAGPAAASTANSSKATKLCGKVSAAAVSSIIGYQVPTGSGLFLNEKASKENDYIAFSALDCTFGLEKSVASIKKSVGLSVETLSRSLTAAELKKLVEREDSITGLKLKIVAYPSLGSEAYLTTFSEAGLTVENLATESGQHLFAATVESSTSASKLASLVKLAETL